jgi:hypothetical protein
MGALLDKAFQRIQEMPEAEQETIAKQILAWLDDDAQWLSYFEANREMFVHLGKEALEAHRRGETAPLDDIFR